MNQQPPQPFPLPARLASRDPLQYFNQPSDSNNQASSLEQALAIYHNNRKGVQIQALLKTFPCAVYLLSESLFATIAMQFIEQRPVAKSLEQVGVGFCRWLALQPQAKPILQDYPFIVALINWECAWHQAYFAPRWNPVCPEQCLQQLSDISSAKLSLPWQLNQGVSVVTSYYAIDEIWSTIRRLLNGKQTQLDIAKQDKQLWLISPTKDSIAVIPIVHQQLSQLQLSRKPWLSRLQPLSADFVAQAIAQQWLVNDYS
ncbi:putative DNA-binding domain-containing protein [Ferrimonas lipolytica]|uniref:DNA-binding domain-containing protein n=1 Tax=Ferrimonas lipolytica TaxID=2724191 RepID=A0A6H1UET8_9GAMM|nr:putative DNA-binding domain-containing protein [Ferrimonas lipolytica]QIZ77110.1 hypothetical protein HER31_09630 [Ferrimonas lipolytica]